jgi:cobalt-zinc-cadmium efflux system protein
MRESEGSIRTAFLLNLAFTLLEFAGGVLTNSLAVTTDALHDLGDSFSLGLAWLFERIAGRKRTDLFSYGYQRFSLLSAVVNAVVLIAGSVLILSYAIPRLFAPEPVDAQGMMVFALLGVMVNGLAAFRVARGKTMNERLVSWHLLEDALGWMGVLAVSIILQFRDLPVLDPAFSVIITLLILAGVLRNFKQTAVIFLQGVPPSVTIEAVKEALTTIPGVVSVHDTHLWSLDGEHHILTLHLVVREDSDKDEFRRVTCEARERATALGITHVTIEIEEEGESCTLAVDY